MYLIFSIVTGKGPSHIYKFQIIFTKNKPKYPA